ncbi:ABC transporter transmembrane domain-containing protein [Xanthovirga aplysinae]|uniref:ABC transporter transmembrane domain-containing protein n=1 Tax=Xanthovirga aplysinae TaxID=2529853 RepID=UPI0016570088|nr:ABC transporter ATP-binding protein [Xanthovirga aplysinae]
MKALSYLNKYLLKYKYHLILGTIFIIISNVFAAIPATLVRNSLDLIIDQVQTYRLLKHLSLQQPFYNIFASTILICGGLILIMALTRGLFLFLTRQTIIVMSRLIEYDLKNEIYAHYQILPLSFYRKNNTGDLMARISEDVSRVRMYLGPAIMYSINLITLFLIVIPQMLSINAYLTLFALLPLPLLSVSIYLVHSQINKRSEEIQSSLSDLSTFVQEAFSGIRVIKSFAREMSISRKFNLTSHEYLEKSLRLTKVNSLFFPLIVAQIGLSVILTVFIGSKEVIQGSLSIGNIAEFIMYVNLLTWPVTSVGWVTSIIQRAAASQDRINEFLQTKTDIISEKNIKRELQGDIRFENVNFTYPDSGIHALRDISFEIKEGETVAIIGTTGSGKSTIANILCRMYDTSSGEVKLDGQNIKDYELIALRGQIGYVPQDVFLFSSTIRENIAFGTTGLTEEQILKAAKDSDLYENIQHFPNGFETELGERGITLSGGQKQRVSIARAIVREPKILILDDCLSAVDTKTENTILNSLKKIMEGRTSVIISHRVSSAKLANKILVLDEGRIIEKGTHDSLLAQNGVYKELYEKQLKTEEEVN